jgi:hypothetical protein
VLGPPMELVPDIEHEHRNLDQGRSSLQPRAMGFGRPRPGTGEAKLAVLTTTRPGQRRGTAGAIAEESAIGKTLLIIAMTRVRLGSDFCRQVQLTPMRVMWSLSEACTTDMAGS